jgi:uncharacterized membrane protein
MENSRATVRIVLAASFLVASYFLIFDAGEYLRNFTASVYGRFWPMRNVMFLHIAAGTFALVMGAVQFCLAFLRRTSTLHRIVGRAYVGAVLVSCVASIVVLRNGSVIGPTWVALLLLLSGSALFFTVRGLIEARRRQWKRHAAWMLRSYMAMMVFAWFRLLWEMPVFQELSPPTRATIVLALTMLVTFVGTELILSRSTSGALKYDPTRRHPTERQSRTDSPPTPARTAESMSRAPAPPQSEAG